MKSGESENGESQARMSREAQTASELFPLLYEELRRLAAIHFRDQPSDHTLQPTALVHEAYLRLADHDGPWRDQLHFLSVASRVMRQALVDHARRQNAVKRGRGWVRVTLAKAPAASEDQHVAVLDLEDALDEIGQLNERFERIVELRFYGGLTIPEVAEVMDVSRQTVENDWKMARALIRDKLSGK